MRTLYVNIGYKFLSVNFFVLAMDIPRLRLSSEPEDIFDCLTALLWKLRFNFLVTNHQQEVFLILLYCMW